MSRKVFSFYCKRFGCESLEHREQHLLNKMDNPNLYHKANEVQRHDAEQIIKEYAHRLHWRDDGTDALLDVGSGSGDVLMDFIYTIMPKKFERIVGSDISPKMVNYARDFYRSYEKCDFKVLDIGTEQDLPSNLKEQFDHVTSFYCLHWIQNKRQALRNIFDLLRTEGGDCLLVFLAYHPVYDVFKSLSKSNKWSSYMKDVDQFINTLHYSQNPKFEFLTLLEEIGFSDIQVDVKSFNYMYKGHENFKDNIKAIDPFLDRIPSSLHASYVEDFIGIALELNLVKHHFSKESGYVFHLPYKLIVAYAQKSSTNSGV